MSTDTATAKVFRLAGYPKIEDTKRPFRLRDETKNEDIRYRCFIYKHNAHIAALIECRWAKVGTTIAVYNASTGRLSGQYTRKVNTVSFLGNG